MFQLLPGFPQGRPLPTPFPSDWGRLSREGLVVESAASDGSTWVGNFQPGPGGIDHVRTHPNGRDVLVTSSGRLWAVNPESQLAVTLAPAIADAWLLADPDRVLFNDQNLAFVCIGSGGVLWRTKRISWDGFKSLHIGPDAVSCEAWSAIDNRWLPFSVNLGDGAVVGGSYEGPEMQFDYLNPE
jgi:hypothetical protein